MTTIHDEEKIKEILTLGSERADYFWGDTKVILVSTAEMLMKKYAEHIRQKTIDEAIACGPDEELYSEFGDSLGDAWTDGWNDCRLKMIENLEKLK